MAQSILRNQKILFGGYDLTGTVNSVAVETGCAILDGTVFGDITKNNKAGLLTVGCGIQGFVDLSSIDKALFDSIGVQGKAISIADSGTEGATVYFFKGFAGGYNPQGTVGEQFKYSLAAAAEGRMVRGSLMENNTGIIATGNGTARQLGAVSATQKLYAAIHVLGVSGTLPTLDVVIKSDASNDFTGAETQRLAFTQATGITSQIIEVSGAITDTWDKIYWTVGGSGSPSFDFIVALGII